MAHFLDILFSLYLLAKYPNVRNIFERNPLFDCCSSTEQQLSIFILVPVYRPKIVIKVVKPARAYPIIYANVIPDKLKPNVYNPIVSPNSAAIIQRISIPSAAGNRFLVILKNNLLFVFRDTLEDNDKDFFRT